MAKTIFSYVAFFAIMVGLTLSFKWAGPEFGIGFMAGFLVFLCVFRLRNGWWG